MDLKGCFIDGNIEAERMLGYRRDELIGRNFLRANLLAKGQLARAASLLAQNILGRPTGPDEFVLTGKDGRQIPVEIRTFPLRVEGRTVIMGIANDITGRKKSEAGGQRPGRGGSSSSSRPRDRSSTTMTWTRA